MPSWPELIAGLVLALTSWLTGHVQGRRRERKRQAGPQLTLPGDR